MPTVPIHVWTTSLLALALPALATTATGEDLERAAAPLTSTLAYDDGETDALVRPLSGGSLEFAMGFSAPTEPNRLAAVSVCLSRRQGGGPTGNVPIRIYEDDGGAPGALLGSFEASVTNVSALFQGSFHEFDLSALAIDLPDRDFFVGIELDRTDNDFHLCLDHDDTTDFRPLYFAAEPGAWEDIRAIPSFGAIRAFMIRATVQSAEPCDAGSDAVFLLGGRFRFDACWRTRDGNGGVGRLAFEQGTGATLWFFNPDNPELFLKVRDACGAFDRYWVFAAGLTDVEVALTVTDTHTGVTRTYFNPLGRAFEPVQDTGGFATCP